LGNGEIGDGGAIVVGMKGDLLVAGAAGERPVEDFSELVNSRSGGRITIRNWAKLWSRPSCFVDHDPTIVGAIAIAGGIVVAVISRDAKSRARVIAFRSWRPGLHPRLLRDPEAGQTLQIHFSELRRTDYQSDAACSSSYTNL
jgi:hypothetical protein